MCACVHHLLAQVRCHQLCHGMVISMLLLLLLPRQVMQVLLCSRLGVL
jgi:hypothetical protein